MALYSRLDRKIPYTFRTMKKYVILRKLAKTLLGKRLRDKASIQSHVLTSAFRQFTPNLKLIFSNFEKKSFLAMKSKSIFGLISVVDYQINCE